MKVSIDLRLRENKRETKGCKMTRSDLLVPRDVQEGDLVIVPGLSAEPEDCLVGWRKSSRENYNGGMWYWDMLAGEWQVKLPAEYYDDCLEEFEAAKGSMVKAGWAVEIEWD